MRILITSDACGGVGVHAEALAAGLRRLGHAVRVIPFGGPEAAFPLEWMTPADGEPGLRRLQAGLDRARAHLAAAAAAWQPDVLHANQFALAGAAPPVPTLLGVHSDVISWWRWVQQEPPPADAYHQWYRALARGALTTAEAVVAPSRACADDIAAQFGYTGAHVIYNGALDGSQDGGPGGGGDGPREAVAVTIGRAWDDAKGLDLLRQRALPCPVWIAGPWQQAGGSAGHPQAGAAPGLCRLGPVAHHDIAALLARAQVYVAPSLYEPFGLAPLEAAFAGCALLLSDIASFREIWEDAAVYFHARDAGDLARQLARLVERPADCRAWGEKARARACGRYGLMPMAVAYARFYEQMLNRTRPWAAGAPPA